jgi:hypothetical protein
MSVPINSGKPQNSVTSKPDVFLKSREATIQHLTPSYKKYSVSQIAFEAAQTLIQELCRNPNSLSIIGGSFRTRAIIESEHVWFSNQYCDLTDWKSTTIYFSQHNPK